MERQFFGTDGIRGRVGEYPITVDFVLKLGWAVGKVFGGRSSGRKLILVGKDTRVSGYMFESALQAGIIAAGVDVSLLGPMPTPAIAYLTRTFRAHAGIVISASHNAYEDNGIKFFGGDGRKLPDAVELEIEDHLRRDIATFGASALGRASRVTDAAGRYVEFCKGTLPAGFNLDGLRLVVDCAHGATYHVAPSVFRELGADIIEIGVHPDGFNINRGCGSTHPQLLQQTLRDTGADLGIALDGDGDRVLFVDHTGALVDGDQLLFVLASHRHRNGGCSGVAGTLMSNLGLELALRHLDIPFARARVGDRHVVELMNQRRWSLGGENSGHILCGDLTGTGDGIVAALQVLRAIAAAGGSLRELCAGMVKLPQTLINVASERPVDVTRDRRVGAAVRRAERLLGARGRVLLRCSGTEPLVRVMVEGDSEALVEQLARDLADVVRGAVGAG